MAFDLSSKTHQQNCLIIYELQCLSMRQRSDFSLVAIAIGRFVFCFARLNDLVDLLLSHGDFLWLVGRSRDDFCDQAFFGVS